MQIRDYYNSYNFPNILLSPMLTRAGEHYYTKIGEEKYRVYYKLYQGILIYYYESVVSIDRVITFIDDEEFNVPNVVEVEVDSDNVYFYNEYSDDE